jgi:tetratricopeptide (TPR) repeat protein
MMLGRAGTPLASWRRRVLRLSFSSSYVLTFLAMHGSERAANYTPVSYQGSLYTLIPIGIPEAIAAPAMALAALVWCSSTAVAGYLALQAAGSEKKRAAPALLLLLTQSLWFVVPAAMRRLDVATGSPEFASVFTAYGFLWVAAAHALQYLWITSYYDGKAHPERTSRMGRVGYFARAALCGYAVWVLPAVLLAPGYLGRLSAEAGLSLMVAAVVNLHHFILDGAVWKLRDKRVANALIASAGPRAPASSPASSVPRARRNRRWLAPLIYSLGAIALSVNLLTSAIDSWAFRGSLDRGDLDAATRATAILGRLGAASSDRRLELAKAYARTGNAGQARRQFAESLRIHETVAGWRGLALLSEQSRDWEAALAAYDRALLLRENDVAALYRSGQVLMWMDELERAIARLERAAALAPEQEAIATTLRRAKRRFEGGRGS